MHPDTLRLFHRLNGVLAAVFGCIANFVLITFVLKSKNTVFRTVFLSVAIIDISFLTFETISEPIVIFVEGSELVLQNGFFRHISQPLNGIMVTGYIFGMYFSITSISVQFFYRYLIICKKIEPSGKVFIKLLIFPFSVSAIIAVIFQFGYTVRPEDEKFATELLSYLLLETEETTVHASSISRKGSFVIKFVGLYIMSAVSINYIIIIFCIIKIQTTLRQTQDIMSKETLQLQRQLSWAFGLQAITPLFISFGPLAYLAYMIIIEGTAIWMMIWLTTGFTWVPFINAIITLLIVGEFRQKLMMKRNVSTSVGSTPLQLQPI